MPNTYEGQWQNKYFEKFLIRLSNLSDGLFVHGVGERYDMKRLPPYTTSMATYWGSTYLRQSSLPCCSSVRFARIDTLEYGWNDKEPQIQFCRAAAATAGSTNSTAVYVSPFTNDSVNAEQRAEKTIQDLIVVSHSMGNIIVAAALSNGYCNFGKSVKWASVQGPWRGSKAVDSVASKCKRGKGILSKLGDVTLDPLLQFLGYCPLSRGHLSLRRTPKVASKEPLLSSYSSPIVSSVWKAYDKYVSAVLCGTSTIGLMSEFSVLTTSAKLVGGLVSSKSDGFVEYSSCSSGHIASFSSSYKDKFYVANVNHVDGTFRNGNGWWGDDRKPLKWLQCLW